MKAGKVEFIVLGLIVVSMLVPLLSSSQEEAPATNVVQSVDSVEWITPPLSIVSTNPVQVSFEGLYARKLTTGKLTFQVNWSWKDYVSGTTVRNGSKQYSQEQFDAALKYAGYTNGLAQFGQLFIRLATAEASAP